MTTNQTPTTAPATEAFCDSCEEVAEVIATQVETEVYQLCAMCR